MRRRRGDRTGGAPILTAKHQEDAHDDSFDDIIAAARPLIASAPVCDALDEHRLHRQILPSSIRPVDDGTVLFGPARTGSYKVIHERVENIYDGRSPWSTI